MKRNPLFFLISPQLFPTPHLQTLPLYKVRLGADAREVLSPTSDSDKQIWKAFCASAARSSRHYVASRSLFFCLSVDTLGKTTSLEI